MIMKEGKKAVSPIVSTVLLIMIVIVLASIIFVWSKGFIKEAYTKQVGGQTQDVNQICSSGLDLAPFVNPDGSFGFTNNGNVPIYGFNLKLISSGTGTSTIGTYFANTSVNPSKTVIVPSNIYNYNLYSQIEIIPIILGTTSGGNQPYTCSETNAITV